MRRHQPHRISTAQANHPEGQDPEARLSRPKSPQQRSDQARTPVNSEQYCGSYAKGSSPQSNLIKLDRFTKALRGGTVEEQKHHDECRRHLRIEEGSNDVENSNKMRIDICML